MHTKLRIRQFILKRSRPFIRKFAPTKLSRYTVSPSQATADCSQMPSMQATSDAIPMLPTPATLDSTQMPPTQATSGSIQMPLTQAYLDSRKTPPMQGISGSTKMPLMKATSRHLEEELFSSSLLRFWRTGADHLAFSSEEDEHLDLAPYRLTPDEYGLNVNADVALWLDARAYDNQPALRQFCDFVFVTPKLHSEFDSFRKKVTSSEGSIFPLVSLLDFWNRKRDSPSSVLTMFGKQYLMLHPSEVDDLCQWVYDARDRGLKLDVKMSPANPIITGDEPLRESNDSADHKTISREGSSKGNSIDVEKVKTPEPTTYWLPQLHLTEDDQRILVDGHWLSSNHISAVNVLLRQHYPEQNGLCCTLQLNSQLRWRSSSINFVQIVHVSENHWVCVSNMLSPPGVCEVFDSLPPTFSSTLTQQVAAMVMCNSEHFTIRYVDVQHQSRADDCGLFAVAFAEALCSGNDPHTLSFDQSKMRRHLQLCFERGAITRFPAATKPRRLRRSRVKISRNIRVYCKCRLPWDKQGCQKLGNMVQCSNCFEWYHQVCLDIPEDIFGNVTDTEWYCNNCT